MYGYVPFLGYTQPQLWFDKRPIKNTEWLNPYLRKGERLKKCLKRHGLTYDKLCGIVRFVSSLGIYSYDLVVYGAEYSENLHKANEFFEIFKTFQDNLISTEYENGLPLASMEFYGRDNLLPNTKTAIVMQNPDGTFDDVKGTGLYDADIKVHRPLLINQQLINLYI